MMGSQLKSMEMQLNSMAAQKSIMGALKGSTDVMAAMQKDFDVSEIREVTKQFAKENAKLEGKQEMMDDAFEMLDDPNAQENADEVYNGILGEIGLQS